MELVAATSRAGSEPTPGYIGRIPVRNLWLLMLYASDLFRIHNQANVDVEDIPDDLPNLIAEILIHAVEKRHRRQFSLGYRIRAANLNRVRGRIDVLNTERHHLLSRGLIACRFNHHTIDIPRNRFVRAALGKISRLVQKDPELIRRCRKLANDFKIMGVSGTPPTRKQMSTEQFGRHDSDDRLMIATAKLVFDLALPTEITGTSVQFSPSREEYWVRRLFERAVGGFFDVVLSHQGWRVTCGRRLNWDVQEQTSGINKILPTMQTDIELDHKITRRRIVIDTKFKPILIPGFHRETTLRSSDIYQMYAYLRTQVGGEDPLADHAEGVLLYPAVEANVDETVRVQGHRIRFLTVNLSASTQAIRDQLLALIEEPTPIVN